jgi:hypothetical protein
MSQRDKKFPVIIYSHGLSTHRNGHATLLKEWASHGYIVFALLHEEDVELPIDTAQSNMKNIRLNQIKVRKAKISSLLDFLEDSEKLHDVFQTDILINTKSISISGHSFGAATAVYTAMNEPRITGNLVLLDPWLYPIEETFQTHQLNRPVLIIRTLASEKIMKETYQNKESCLNLLKKNNKTFLGHSICCTYENSNRISQTDLIFYLPRELKLAKMMKRMDNIEVYVKVNHNLTSLFFNEMNKEIKATYEQVLNKFRRENRLEKKNQSFIVDQI